MIYGQLFKLEWLNDLPVMSVYTPTHTTREYAMTEALRSFYGVQSTRQLLFMHDDGELELWNPGTVAEYHRQRGLAQAQ